MAMPDLNLLITLDVLLAEGSVARAARRLRLSPSAMSRALARLREATGDPLLVRAGRGLVPTPRALELRQHTGQLLQESIAMLSPAQPLELSKLVRTFTLRTREEFVENFGAQLIERVLAQAPGVRLRFMRKSDRSSTQLRDGAADLEVGVVDSATGPEIRMQTLFRDRFVAVVRCGHPLSQGAMTLARYAEGRHISVARDGVDKGPIDEALSQLGLVRQIATVVDSFSAALALARPSDLIASVPERHTGNLRAGMVSLPLPVAAMEVTVSLLWHPRQHADAAHRWLRALVLETCGNC